MGESPNPFATPLMDACLDLIPRLGTSNFRIGYTDEDAGEPVVWYATVTLAEKLGGGNEADAAMTPQAALVRLLERLVDAAVCVHCGKPSGLSTDPVADFVEDAWSPAVCWYRLDPGTRKFRRSCEGLT